MTRPTSRPTCRSSAARPGFREFVDMPSYMSKATRWWEEYKLALGIEVVPLRPPGDRWWLTEPRTKPLAEHVEHAVTTVQRWLMCEQSAERDAYIASLRRWLFTARRLWDLETAANSSRLTFTLNDKR